MNGIQRNQIATLETAIKNYLAQDLDFIGLDIQETGKPPNTKLNIIINFKNYYSHVELNHRGTMRDNNGKNLKKYGRIISLPKLIKIK